MILFMRPKYSVLPPEVMDRMIASVWPDTRTLLHCALVCRDWLPASRHHLFRAISLRPRGYKIFLSRVLRSDTLRPYLSSVRSLVVLDDGRPQRQGPSDQPLVEDSTNFTTLGMRSFAPELAGHLPRLEHLEMSVEWLEVPPHPSSWLALSRFDSVRVLHLRHCTFQSFHALRHALTALPALTSVELIWVMWGGTPSDSLPHRRFTSARPELSTLTLDSLGASGTIQPMMTRQLVAWLSTTPTARSLRRLSINLVASTHELLITCGPCFPLVCSFVRELSVSVNWSEGQRDDGSLLSSFAMLKTLILHLRWNDTPEGWDRGVGQALRSLPCPTLLRTLHFKVQCEGTFDGIDVLDDVLESFDSLEHVGFALGYRESRTYALRAYQSGDRSRRLADISRRGLRALVLEDLRGTIPKLFARGTVRIRVSVVPNVTTRPDRKKKVPRRVRRAASAELSTLP